MGLKNISIAAIVLVAILGLFAWGKSAAPAAPASHNAFSGTGVGSRLTADSTFYDFGTISMKNGNVTKDFIIKNQTGEDITISTVVTSCMCTTAYVVSGTMTKGPFGMSGMGYVPPANETIGPGESRTVRVVYDPNAHGPAGVGAIDRFVALNDSSGGTLQLEIKAVVTP